MDVLFQRLIDNNFSELDGLFVHASVPVTETLANEFIASTLADNPEIEHCRITIHPENRILASVKSRRLPWILNLKLRLFGTVDVSHSPVVRAFLENNVLLARLGALLRALPPGINMYEDHISVDIGILTPPEQRKFLELIKAVEIKTEEGRLILDVTIEK